PIPWLQLAAGLRRERLAVQEVASRGAVSAAPAAAGSVPSPLGDQRVAQRLQGLDLADDTLAAAPRSLAAAAAAHRELPYPERELRLQRLDRGVQGVGHRDVDRARPVGVRAGALAAADRLVVGEVLAGEGQVVHRSLTLGLDGPGAA